MDIKEIFNRILFYITVPKCVFCKEKLDYGERGLCKKCMTVYRAHKQRNCHKCAKILPECNCTYDYLESHGIKNLVKVFRYSKSDQSLPSNYLIYSLKQDNRSDVFSFLADELTASVKNCITGNCADYIITNVPRRKNAVISFGYDHAKRLAKDVSERLGIDYVELLNSKSKKPQKSVHGHERIENAKFEYRSDDDFNLKGKTVILIDDIVTTGASMTNCATLIRGFRPKRIIGACLGTAYKEPYIDYRDSAIK